MTQQPPFRLPGSRKQANVNPPAQHARPPMPPGPPTANPDAALLNRIIDRLCTDPDAFMRHVDAYISTHKAPDLHSPSAVKALLQDIFK